MWPFDPVAQYFGATAPEFRSLLVGMEKDRGFGPVRCPKCGSPYMVRRARGETKPPEKLENFKCVAGDCGYEGPISQYEIEVYAPGWRTEYESLFSQPR